MPNQAKPKMPETLADALAAFQKQVKTANREGTATEKRGNRETTRKYSTLEDLLKSLEPALELGISHSQTFDFIPLENEVLTILVTTLFFKDEKIESKLPLRDPKGFNPMHALGTAITYSRRYALGAIYGIGSEEDDDAMSLNSYQQKEESNRSKITSTPKRASPTQAKKVATNIIAAATPSSNDPERKATEDERSRVKGQVTEFLKTHDDSWASIVTHFNQEFNKTSDKIFENVTQLKHCLFLAEKMTGIINASR